jgi:hypothetical protein
MAGAPLGNGPAHAAGVGDTARDLVALIASSRLVERADGGHDADAAELGEARGTGQLPHRLAPGDGERVSGLQPQLGELGQRGLGEPVELGAAAERRNDDSATQVQRRRQPLGELVLAGRGSHLDADDACVARELQQPHHCGPRDPQALRDFVLREILLVARPETLTNPGAPVSNSKYVGSRYPIEYPKPEWRAAGIAMAFTLIESAQHRWRAVNSVHLGALVRAGAKVENGVIVE